MEVINGERNENSISIIKNEVEYDMIENNRASPNVSDYDSANGANSSEDEGAKDFQHSNHGSDGEIILEREEGDGQESTPSKKVDDDEDKKNPQYIPKRGTFYEHDDRTLDDSQEKEEPSDKQNKKTVWIEKKERWSHDLYNDNEQIPKSRTELISIYGYDIRNEDGPPRARRRRRYGRGPNKYTRTWEDEDAYKPIKPVKTVKKPKNKNEEYPPLNKTDEQNENEIEPEPNLNGDEVIIPKKPSPPALEVNKLVYKKLITSEHSNVRAQQQRIGTGRIVKPKPEIKREIKDSDYKGFTKTRQFRNSKSEQKVLPKNPKKEKKDDLQPQENQSNQSNIDDVETDFNKLNMQEGVSKNLHKTNGQRQTSVPPRLQTEHKASKRYSSLRQRSLPETTNRSFQQSPNYYINEYNQQTSAPPQPPNILPQPTPVPQIPPPPLPPLPQQVTVTPTSILQAPPQFAGPFPQAPPTFLQPAVPPAAFIPQPAAPIINYVQGQPQYTPAPPPFQGFQHQQFNTVNQPAELYQYQGGTTYYSTQNQHLGQRIVPQKRRTAAIPILPPPPQEPRGRGRTSIQRDTPSGDQMQEFVINECTNDYEDSLVIHQSSVTQ